MVDFLFDACDCGLEGMCKKKGFLVFSWLKSSVPSSEGAAGTMTVFSEPKREIQSQATS